MEADEARLAYVSVSAIIERTIDDREEVLLQERWHGGAFDGRLEIPGGRLRIGEHPLDGLRREVQEECGLDITEIWPNWIQETNDAGKLSLAFQAFCCEGAIGAYSFGFVWVCRGQGTVRKEGLVDGRLPRWVSLDVLSHQLKNHPTLFTPYHLAALRFYVKEKQAGHIWHDRTNSPL